MKWFFLNPDTDQMMFLGKETYCAHLMHAGALSPQMEGKVIRSFHVNNKLDTFKIRKAAPCPGGVCGPLNYHARSRQGQRWGKASQCPGGACRPPGYQAGVKAI